MDTLNQNLENLSDCPHHIVVPQGAFLFRGFRSSCCTTRSGNIPHSLRALSAGSNIAYFSSDAHLFTEDGIDSFKPDWGKMLSKFRTQSACPFHSVVVRFLHEQPQSDPFAPFAMYSIVDRPFLAARPLRQPQMTLSPL